MPGMRTELSVKVGDPVTIVAADTLTASYQYSDAVLLDSYDSIALTLSLDTTEAATGTFKYQWSNDTKHSDSKGVTVATPSNWFNEPIEVQGTASGGELPCTASVHTTVVDLNTTGPLPVMIRSKRMGRWFRLGYKAGGTTTCKLTVTAMPMSNCN